MKDEQERQTRKTNKKDKQDRSLPLRTRGLLCAMR